MTYQFLAVAIVLLVVVGCSIDAYFHGRNKRIPLSNDGSAVGHDGTIFDCGGGDGGGCD